MKTLTLTLIVLLLSSLPAFAAAEGDPVVVVGTKEIAAIEAAVSKTADPIAALGAVSAICPDESTFVDSGDLISLADSPNADVAKRKTAVLRRVARSLATAGHLQLGMHANVCAVKAAKEEPSSSSAKRDDRSPEEIPFTETVRAILTDMKAIFIRWSAEDARDAALLRRTLGKASQLVLQHNEARASLTSQVLCIDEYLKENKVTGCTVDKYEGVARAYWALGGHSRKGAGDGGAIVTSARLDLGLTASIASSEALEKIVPSITKRWGEDEGERVGITARFLRGIVSLEHGDEATAAKLMPRSDLEEHDKALSWESQRWFDQLLLLRSRVRRDRGQIGDALDDTSHLKNGGVIGILEHAENLRASGRLREAEFALRPPRNNGQGGGGACGAAQFPNAEARQKAVARAAAYERFATALGTRLRALADDVYYCRPAKPDDALATLARAIKECPECKPYEKEPLQKLEKIIAQNAALLRTGGVINACDKVDEALEATQLSAGLSEEDARLNDRAITYFLEGRFEEAKKTLEEPCAFSGSTASFKQQSNLGAVLFSMGRLDEATTALTRARQLISPDKPPRARIAVESNLGMIDLARGKADSAKAHFTTALTAARTAGDRDLLAQVLDDNAIAEDLTGKYDDAAKLYNEALHLREERGQEHPAIATSLSHLATLSWARGDTAKALPLFQRMMKLEEEHLVRLLAWGTEASKRDALARLSNRVGWLVTFDLAVRKDDEQAKELAFASIISRKGRALDAATRSHGALFARLSSKAKPLFEELRRVNERMVWLSLRGSKSEQAVQLTALKRESARLEGEIATELGALDRAAVKGLEGGAKTLAKELRPNQALVEYVLYRPFHPERLSNREDEPSYAAYVLTPNGKIDHVDLGSAAKIDGAVREARAALGNHSAQYEPALRELSSLIFAPIEKRLGGAHDVLVVPDSSLHLVPFDALRDGQGDLIRRYRFTTLTTSRDLVQPPSSKAASASGLVVFANPEFGVRGKTTATTAADVIKQEGILANVDFSALPGTGEEAKGIAKSFPNAKVVLAREATGKAFKSIASPQILHVATHGFFVSSPSAAAAAKSQRGLVLMVPEGGSSPAAPELPEVSALYRSGLAFAGANLAQPDAIVAGIDLAAINLTGTKLVTLSACESGLGETTSGDGVYGLRRALYLAGSETQVLSLWKVDDEATSDLMIAFYGNLQRGMSRGEALRRAKLTLAASARFAHPYYWAAFVLSGSENKLDGSPPEPLDANGGSALPSVKPGARGCGCDVIGAPPQGQHTLSIAGGAFLLFLVLLLRLRLVLDRDPSRLHSRR